MDVNLSKCKPESLLDLLIQISNGLHDGRFSDVERVTLFRRLAENGLLPNYSMLLPLLLNLSGQPYTLNDHFPFEPVFQTSLVEELLMKTARQVAKSTSMAARSCAISAAIPHFSMLFMTPLYEQIRRFSTNYIRPFIEQSPLKNELIGTGTENSVLQRSFKNYSKMYFSFALTSADRVRGVSAHANNFDEVQDMDPDLLPIIKETMSASKWRLSMYTGTPKTLDNTIEALWLSSSQAEWCIPCNNCKKLNVPRMGEDLEKMIGPWREDISEHLPGVVCANARCRLPIQPRNGRWLHRYPERRLRFPSYHIPQIIMPIHYADPKRWSELLAKRQGYGNMTIPQFYNEVLGESYDLGAKLVTKSDLENASVLPWANDPLYAREAIARKSDYIMRVLGVDWGGGGEVKFGSKKDPEKVTLSFTSMAVVGLRPDGKLDVIYGRRLLTPHDHMEEAKQVLRMYNLFDCHLLAHDYNGAGALRETIAVQSGLPLSKIAPIVYTRSAHQNLMYPHKSESKHSRNYWMLDKARSLQLLCQCIKLGQVRFFKHDYVSEEQRGLQMDFVSLMENRLEMPRGPDVYMITRNPHFPDDFAHAVNYAAGSIWHSTQGWPNIAQLAGLQLTIDQMNQISPMQTWGENESSGYFNQP